MKRTGCLRCALAALFGIACLAPGCGQEKPAGEIDSLQLTFPNGGESFTGAQQIEVAWITSWQRGNVDIECELAGQSPVVLAVAVADDGSELVTIPEVNSSEARIRISAADGDPAQVSNPSDVSDAPFTIVTTPMVNLISPNGGESWTGGSANLVSWEARSYSGVLEIELSTDGGESWSILRRASAANGSTYVTPPNIAAAAALVRISAADDDAGVLTAPWDQCDSPLTIVGVAKLTVTAPHQYATWPGLTTQMVQWRTENYVGAVDIELLTSEESATLLAANTENDGSQPVSVPNIENNSVRVRVSAADGDPAVTNPPAGVSGYISVTGSPVLSLLSPNGGESWVGGDDAQVSWRTEYHWDYLDLEYSLDGGDSWTLLESELPNNSSCWIAVPNIDAPSLLMRMSGADGDAAMLTPPSDATDAPLTIVPTSVITILQPNGGETWVGNSSETVTWESQHYAGNVDIEYLGYAGWQLLVADTPNDGSETIAAPNFEFSLARIRVSAADGDPNTLTPPWDQSDADFTYQVVPLLTLLSPNGGESWAGLSSATVTWSWYYYWSAVDLEYSLDGGATWSMLVAGVENDGSADVSVPNIGAPAVLVRISAADGDVSVLGEPHDVSDASFAISPTPTLTVLYPNGGETLHGLDSVTVTWSSTFHTGNVDIEVDDGWGWLLVASNIPDDGSESVVLPNGSTSYARVRVSGSDGDPAEVTPPSDTSDSSFTLLPTPALELSSPNGGEVWTGLASANVTWSSIAFEGTLDIELSSDGGATWTILAASTANDGSQSVSVPNLDVTNALVRISVADGDPAAVISPVAVSASPFSIAPTPVITVTSQSTAEEWPSGGTAVVTWSSQYYSGNIDIDYRNQETGSYATLAANLADTGSATVSVPEWHSYRRAAIRVVVSGADGDPSSLSFPHDQSLAEISIVPLFEGLFGGGLGGCHNSALACLDDNADGAMDVAVSGIVATSTFIRHVWLNDGSGAYGGDHGIPPVEMGAIDAGDFDNDGWVDLAIIGLSGSINGAYLSRNNGGTGFPAVTVPFTPAMGGDVAWADHDNDGDLDLLLGGYMDEWPWAITELYRNDSGTFTAVASGLPQLGDSSFSWGDYDGDGDLDLAIMGYTNSNAEVTDIYRNDGGALTPLNAGLAGSHWGSLSWGDFDADGDLDLAVLSATHSAIYANDSGTFEDIGAPLPSLIWADLAWGDYDDDGDLDLAYMGANATNALTRILRNDAGTFVDIDAGLIPVWRGGLTWMDADGDGDFDLVFTGTSRINSDPGNDYSAAHYRNNLQGSHSPPTAPGGLSATVEAGGVRLGWNPATDAETPSAGLTYNLMIGHSSPTSEHFPAMAKLDGTRLVAKPGPIVANGTPSHWVIEDLAAGTYYFRVQAIDSTNRGGPWSDAFSFVVP